MNQETQTHTNIATLIDQINTRDLHLIVTFLDAQTIDAIMSCQGTSDSKRSRFVQVVRIRYFIHNYLTRMDRSIYMPFYSDDSFIRIQHDLQRQMCHISSNVLSFLFNNYNHLSSHFFSQLAAFEQAQDTIKSITDTLVDPQLPFPKLRKQTVGMHCNSAFQYFLVDRLFSSPDDQYLDEPYEQLKLFVEQQWSKLPDPSPEQAYLMGSVLCKWFKISYQNFQEYLIEGNTNHNLIILVIALIDLIIDTFRFYIQSIKDPLHSFVQFNMRYCIFRNSILRLEQNLGFLFKGYTEYCYNRLEKEAESREMTIWHIALSKWYLHLHRNHEEYFRMYFYLLRKVNFIAIKEEAQNRQGEDNAYMYLSSYIRELKNLLELNDIDLLQRQECFQLYSPIEQFFQADTTLYKQIIQEYIEYTIDISINQFSVHWCGHSYHQLHVPYINFQNLFLPEFKSYLLKVVSITKQIPKSIVAVDQIICSLLNQLDCDYLKPVTLKKVIDIVKQELQGRLGKYFEQTLMFKKIKEIQYYFSVEDKKLQMFNNQNNIGNEATIKYSIIVEDEEFSKMLEDSSSTIATKRAPRVMGLNIELSHSMQEERNC